VHSTNRPVLLRLASAATATLVVSGLALVVPAAGPAAGLATAAPPPGPYTAAAHGDIVRLDAALLGGSVAGVSVGHAQTVADTVASPEVTSTSANVELALGGTDIPVDRLTATAPPSSDPPGRTLLPVPLAPVATAGVISGDVAASYVDDATCPPAAGAQRAIGTAATQLAGLSVLGVPGLASTAAVAASTTSTTTRLVDAPGDGDLVVSRTTTDVGDVALLGGAAIVRVA
jgi:hypothetical protein